jgi:bifunctional DNA-binding transcriptional regulator/antitoxin component of YhaV-PrlF toxin-antitoxin module
MPTLSHEPPTSLVTGKLQTTIPAVLARRHGIKTGTRLEWVSDEKRHTITAKVLPGNVARLRVAQGIAARNSKAATKLRADFAADRVWQREHGPMV